VKRIFLTALMGLATPAWAHNSDKDMICTLSGINGAPSVAISFANNTIFLDRGESKGTYVETSRGDARAPRPVWAWELIAGPRIILKDLAHPGALIELIPGEKPDSLGISYMPAVAKRDGVIVAQGKCGAPMLMGEVVETSSTSDQGKNP
jgi:hypothetical protein